MVSGAKTGAGKRYRIALPNPVSPVAAVRYDAELPSSIYVYSGE